jgi:hypothetical protein
MQKVAESLFVFRSVTNTVGKCPLTSSHQLRSSHAVTTAGNLLLSKSVYLPFLGTGLYPGNHKRELDSRVLFAWREVTMTVPPTGEVMVMSETTEVDKTATQRLQVIFEPATLCKKAIANTV